MFVFNVVKALSFRILLLIYLLQLFSFAVVYLVLWQSDLSSFVPVGTWDYFAAEELMANMAQDYRIIDGEAINISAVPSSQSALAHFVLPFYQKAYALDHNSNRFSSQLDSVFREYGGILKTQPQSDLFGQFNIYFTESLVPATARRDSLAALVSYLRKRGVLEHPEVFQYIDGSNLELAQLAGRYALAGLYLANTKVKVLNDAMLNITDNIEKESARAAALVKRTRALSDSISSLEAALGKTFMTCRAHHEQWKQALKGSLHFSDFMLFSLGVATTNSFGNVVPRSPTAQWLAVLQFLISMLVTVAFFLRIAEWLQSDESYS